MINKFIILNGTKYFSSEIFQNYLVFIPDKNYIKYFNDTNQIYLSKLNRMPEKSIRNITKSSSLFVPTFVNHFILRDVTFNGQCFKINNIFIHKKVTNIYISYILNQWPPDLNTNFILGSCLFGSVKLIKNADPDKCMYKVVMVFDSICLQNCHYLTVAWEKMSLFLKPIWAHLCILIIREKIS